MAKITEAKSTQGVEDWFDSSINEVLIQGQVKRVFFNSDKVIKFTLDAVTKTPSDKYSHSFIPVTLFTGGNEVTVEEGEIIKVTGNITTSSYNGKYTTEVCTNFDNVEFIEEIPFN